MSVCPLCLDVYAVNGSCSCDVDGVPPSAWCPWPAPVVLVGGRRGGAARANRRVVLVNRESLDGDVVAAGTCACGRPTRDHAYICSDCSAQLDRLFERLPQVMVDLDSRLTASIRGIDYTAWAEPRSAGSDVRPGALPAPAEAWLRANEHQGTANPVSLPILPHVVDARADLISGVRLLVAMALQARLTPTPGRPVSDVASWLRARVDAMTLHPAFVGTPYALNHLVSRALASVAPYVATSEQGGIDATVRDRLMQTALTASEIAVVAIRVGELDGTQARDTSALRERIRTTVNDWHRRGRIEPVSYADNGRPRFRFGEVHLLLLRAPAPRPAARPEPTPARPGLDGLASWPNHHPTTKENR